MKDKKLITLEIKNKHLDALEDLLYAELDETQKAKVEKQVKDLWHSLVEAYGDNSMDSGSSKKVKKSTVKK